MWTTKLRKAKLEAERHLKALDNKNLSQGTGSWDGFWEFITERESIGLFDSLDMEDNEELGFQYCSQVAEWDSGMNVIRGENLRGGMMRLVWGGKLGESVGRLYSVDQLEGDLIRDINLTADSSGLIELSQGHCRTLKTQRARGQGHNYLWRIKGSKK